MILRSILPAPALLLTALLTTTAWACDAGPSGPGGETQALCSVYMTPNECLAHQHILSMLTEAHKRNAYLAMYTMLIDERQALCRASAERRTVGLLTYFRH